MKAAEVLDDTIRALSASFALGEDYFKILVKVFETVFTEEKLEHLKGFFMIGMNVALYRMSNDKPAGLCGLSGFAFLTLRFMLLTIKRVVDRSVTDILPSFCYMDQFRRSR